MSYQILKSKNNFYIYDGRDFFGSFHSIADAERNLKNIYKNSVLKLNHELSSFNFITNIYTRE